MFSYIYKFTNKENGMVYIGQTIAPKKDIKHISTVKVSLVEK